jgi:redox-sensing transcriptional repressor
MSTSEFTKRLLSYRLSLYQLKDVGLQDVFSHLIASETGYSAPLVRKDFSRLKIRGKRRGGYSIDTILNSINEYFGKDMSEVILVGMGHIGMAIAHYKNFEKQNIRIRAAFDINPVKQRRKYNIPVYPMSKCQEVINKYHIETAVIAVPALSAQTVLDQLIHCGIKGILNFAPANLKVPEKVFVSNVSICDELRRVIYHASEIG